MPRYVYECMSCKRQFECSHGMFYEKEDCDLCHSKYGLIKIPSFNIKKEDSLQRSSGALVNEYIEDTREEVKKEKRRLREEEL